MNLHPIKILLVEDDPSMMSLLIKTILKVIPEAKIIAVSSFIEAIKNIIENTLISETTPFELIIADIFLKDRGTGLDLWRILRSLYPRMPILVISSLSEINVATAVGEREKKWLFFLKKPFVGSELKHKIHNIVEFSRGCEGLDFFPALTEFPLLKFTSEHQRIAYLFILKISADWLEKQIWIDIPYGGQNQAQEILYASRRLENTLCNELFVRKNKKWVGPDPETIRKQLDKMSTLAPELSDFIGEKAKTMEEIFKISQ